MTPNYPPPTETVKSRNPTVSEDVSRNVDRSRILGIDVLRGIAILAVVLVHIPHHAHGGWRNHLFFLPSFFIGFGYLGVPLFVTISGFCIHRRIAFSGAPRRMSGGEWRTFWKRRFLRLYPPYVAAMIFSVLIAYYLGTPLSKEGTFWGDVLTHTLLIHNLTHEYSGGMGNGAFWSLGMEEQLYALYPILLWIWYRYSTAAAISTAVAISVTWIMLIPVFDGWKYGFNGLHLGNTNLWPWAYWMPWALGALAAEAAARRVQLNPVWYSGRLAWGLIAIGIIGSERSFTFFENVSSIPVSFTHLLKSQELSVKLIHQVAHICFLVSFFIFMNRAADPAGATHSHGLTVSLFARLGIVSYSIYLTHIPLLNCLERAGLYEKLTSFDYSLRFVISLPLVLLLGIAFFYFIERRWLPKPESQSRNSTELFHNSKALSNERLSVAEPTLH